MYKQLKIVTALATLAAACTVASAATPVATPMLVEYIVSRIHGTDAFRGEKATYYIFVRDTISAKDDGDEPLTLHEHRFVTETFNPDRLTLTEHVVIIDGRLVLFENGRLGKVLRGKKG